MSALHKGGCFCGAVEVEASGDPQVMGYCHCGSCRSWSGCPMYGFTIWPAAAVKVTTGAQHVGTFHKTADSISHRKYCTKCGGHLMIDHPTLGVVDVCAATLPALKFAPAIHVNYAETVLPMKDGLPKFRDFPGEFGGSGQQLPE